MSVIVESPVKTLFVHLQKTGGMSVQNWLITHCNGRAIKRAKHTSYEGLLEIVDPPEWSFTVTRNPWARAVSFYFYQIEKHEQTIKDIQENGVDDSKKKHRWDINLNQKRLDKLYKGFENYILNSYRSATTNKHAADVDTILKLENINEDFKIVQEKLQCFEPLPVLNTSSHLDYRHYYNDTTKKIIAEKYAEDIEKFDYTF